MNNPLWLAKAKTYFLIFAVGLVMMQCGKSDPLVATWKIIKINYQPSPLATPEAFLRDEQIKAMQSGFQNSTFALYEGQRSAFFSTEMPYRQGTWSIDGNRLSLQIGGRTTFPFDIVEQNENTLILVLAEVGATDGELTLTCQRSEQYIYGEVDLLAPEQNEWRVKPKQRQTETQIRQRAIAQLDYLIHYFECVKKNKQTYFETGLVGSPFIFYAHGLGLSKESPSAKRWQRYFYDRQDANRAFDYLKKSIKTLDKYPKADTFTEEYLLAFKKMRTYFDQ
ncbi:lipocalin family protein [Persicitalea sp.]|uniref:lipocalin family protein n=1 Tax=Persicitalea sp. TaxID=3100273 RepID=UPI003592FFB7